MANGLCGAGVQESHIRFFLFLLFFFSRQAYNAWKAKKEAEGASEGGAGASSGGGTMSSLFAKRFYEGGFEDKMTRREAALILGVR